MVLDVFDSNAMFCCGLVQDGLGKYLHGGGGGRKVQRTADSSRVQISCSTKPFGRQAQHRHNLTSFPRPPCLPPNTVKDAAILPGWPCYWVVF